MRGSGLPSADESDATADGSDPNESDDRETTKRTMTNRIGISTTNASPVSDFRSAAGSRRAPKVQRSLSNRAFFQGAKSCASQMLNQPLLSLFALVMVTLTLEPVVGANVLSQ